MFIINFIADFRGSEKSERKKEFHKKYSKKYFFGREVSPKNLKFITKLLNMYFFLYISRKKNSLLKKIILLLS